MKFQVIFSCKNVLRVFVEVVEASNSEEAKKLVEQKAEEVGLTVYQFTAVIQLT